MLGIIPATSALAATSAHWRFEGNGSTTIVDSSANGNDGTLPNGLTREVDVPVDPLPINDEPNTQSAAFNGANQACVVPDAPTLRPANALTIECWINLIAGARAIVSKQFGDGSQNSYILQLQFGTRITFEITDVAAGTQAVFGPELDDAAGWTHIAATWDGTVMRLYIDGVLHDEETPYSGTIAYDASPVLIGADDNDGPVDAPSCCYFRGGIDEVRISDTALLPNEFLNFDADLEPPTVTAFTPANATNDQNAVLTVTFSERMSRSSVVAGWTVDVGGTPVVPDSIASADDLLFRFVPSAPLDFGTVTSVLGGGVTDASGNPIDGNGDGTGGDAFAWQFDMLRPDTTLTLAFPEGRYVLASIPLGYAQGTRLADVLGPALGPQGSQRWDGYAWIDGRLVNNPTVASGRGYWVATANSTGSFALTGPALGAGDLVVPLRPGFNLIGVPSYTNESGCVDWSTVSIRRGQETLPFGDRSDTAPVFGETWWWEDDTGDHDNANGDYVLGSDQSSWDTCNNAMGGYFVFAREAVDMIVPGASGRPWPAPSRTPEAADWQLSITATSDRGRSNRVTVGLRHGSRNGYDPTDVFTPPPPASRVRLVGRQAGGPWPEYMRLWSAPDATISEFAIDVVVDGNDAVALQWQESGGLPAGRDVYLIDDARDVAIDMSAFTTHELFVAGTRSLRVVVRGDEPRARVLGAPRFDLRASPNPLAGPLTIDFEVRRAGAVQVRLLDVLGRSVERIFDAAIDRGPVQVRWQPRAALARGTYFVELRGRDGVLSRKIQVLR